MMVSKRLVAIGADGVGMSVASGLQLIPFDRGDFASYSRCGLGDPVPVAATRLLWAAR